MSGLALALALLAVPVLLSAAYLFALTALSARLPAPASGAPHLRFDVVVPAHDEEAGIAATVRSVLAADYPAELRRVLVVADNCSDATAARAREAGAEVLVRDDPGRRGKGYALQHAFARSLSEGIADAVVVVDADTSVSPNLLAAFAARLDAGAAAIQSDNAVQNPQASWRTCLMAIAFALFNTLRSQGRERLRCSAGLRGTGMCLSSRLLREVPYQAFSVVEDLEYGIRLGQAGHRVHFAAEARVLSDMEPGERESRSQRRRWEGGRRRLASSLGPAVLWRGLRERDLVQVDLGIDLLVPPLAQLFAAALAGAAAAALASAAARRPLPALWLFGASVALLSAYLARGWALSGQGIRGVAALARAPLYLLWKLGLARGRPRGGVETWVRTSREGKRRRRSP